MKSSYRSVVLGSIAALWIVLCVSLGLFYRPDRVLAQAPQATLTVPSTYRVNFGLVYGAGSPVPIRSATATSTPTRTSTPSATYTPTSTVTSTPTDTRPRLTDTPSPTSAPTRTPTNTCLPSDTPVTPTDTPFPTQTDTPASMPTPTPTVGTSPAFEQRVIELTNRERTSRGLVALTRSQALTNAARGHSEDMARNNFFSHTGSDGSSPGQRISRAGYNWWTYGENIAAGYPSPEHVVDAWMNSAGHRANILNPNFRDIGVGYIYKPDTTYGHYWTQDMGAR